MLTTMLQPLSQRVAAAGAASASAGAVGAVRVLSRAFHDKVMSVERALELIGPSDNVVTAMAACEPEAFFHTASKPHPNLGWKNVSISCANPSQAFPMFHGKDLGIDEIRVMFLTSAVRGVQGHDVVHYVPQNLSAWAGNLLSEPRGVDVFWGSCSVPDSRGFVSLSLSAVYEPEVLASSKKVVLEINPQLPTTFGDTLIHTSDVDAFVLSDHPIETIQAAVPSPTDRAIAEYVADLVPDGATLQLGIGGIPNAVASLLESKKDIGVHTEMMNDAMMDLYKKGVITGSHKSRDVGKITATFALGSPELYRFIDNNPMIVLKRGSLVNDPYIIGKQSKMVSINTCVELDITGQVCSESVGHRELSGVGGAADTHRGAQLSPGGRGIIAVHSTGKNKAGELYSKIVFELHAGAKISISRNDIDTIVTEFGVAHLKGLSVAARARALIAIAHPDFRDELEHKARTNGYI